MAYTQWSETNGSFTPVGGTAAEVKPGYYDIISTQTGIYFVPVRARDDDLIEFEDSASIAVLKGITDFWEREPVFKKYNFPYRRGIILYGPPGSGKSCTLQMVSRDVVKRGGVVLTFPDSTTLFLSAYRAFRDIQPETPIVVLMEDFEVTLGKVDESKLLNLLDGVESLHKTVFIATTNYPELLKDRVINRPSRFDIRILVPHPNARMRKAYLATVIHEDDNIDVDRYVRDTEGLSLAHVKELFVSVQILGADYAQTVQRLQTMKQKVTSLDALEIAEEPVHFASGGYV